jgi:dihydroorotate dehydrogenase
LRDLQHGAALDELLQRVMAEKQISCPNTPILLKIAPDLHLTDLDDVVRVALNNKIDGLIVSNTTITRPDHLKSTNKFEAGGLSGKPLFDLSTRMLAETYLRVEGKVPLVGVGGIHDAATAIQKLQAGATLIQLYSALVYKGLPLIDEVKSGILAHLKRENTTLETLTGSKSQDWRMKR